MKFTIHNLRMIKARFSSNGWVLAELFLVFIVMWFLCDSLGCMKYTFYRPLGYNIEHVYKLSTVVGGEGRDTSLTDADKYLGILAKLEQEPSVEAAALCYWSLPMSGSNSYNALVVQDTSWVQGRCIYTTGGYMDVFRISEDPRHPFRDTPAGWNNVTLSNAAFERFRKKMPEFSQTTPLGNGDSVTIDAGLPVAVITESVARRLFQTTEAVGREFLLNHAPYTVSGVVKDVSTLANTAYAQVWVPYTSTEITKSTWSDEHMGMMSVTILAKSRDDFPAIREETERRRQEYDTVIGENGYSLIYRNRPYDQEKNAAGMAANIEPDVDQARRQRLIIFIILLIVPAINLSSMTQSRLRQRVAEIGVRRAFGSTRLELMGQIIAENLVVTLLAGVMGLLLSVAFAYLGNTLLFAQEFSKTLSPPAVDASILLHGSTFGWALLFCFVLNLLSSGIPAWRASRIGIVNALGGRLHK